MNLLLALDMHSNLFLKFLVDYLGSHHVLTCSTNKQNIGNLHPIKLYKLFQTEFTGIQRFKSIGSQRVKITFNDITQANSFLSSYYVAERTQLFPLNILFTYY